MTPSSGSPRPRACSNWLNTLLDYVEETEPPRNFWIWAGISTIASALQRKVWLPFGLETLYPNLYVMIVAPPGRCRKGSPVSFSKKILTQIQSPVFVDSPTKRALTKAMDAICATSFFKYKGEHQVQCPISLISKELSSFLAVDPKSMIEVLTDLFDSHDVWEYKTSEKGEDKLYGVCVNCFFATTPKWLSDNLPDEAIGGGFTSRFLLIYGLDKYKHIPIPPVPPKQLLNKLTIDLAHISRLVGEFHWEEEARLMYEEWYRTIATKIKGMSDERLHGYMERIHVMAIKSSMCLSVGETDSLIIRSKDMAQSIRMVEAVVQHAPKALGAQGRNPLAYDTDRIAGHIRALGKIPFQELLKMNYMHVDKPTLLSILESLQSMGRVKIDYSSGEPVAQYLTHRDEQREKRVKH